MGRENLTTKQIIDEMIELGESMGTFKMQPQKAKIVMSQARYDWCVEQLADSKHTIEEVMSAGAQQYGFTGAVIIILDEAMLEVIDEIAEEAGKGSEGG